MENNIDVIYWTDRNGITKAYLSRYNILQDGKCVKSNVKTWKEALAHAIKYTSNILREHKVEIVNVWTGEIITYEEAQRRAKEWIKKHSKMPKDQRGAAISGTN